MGDNGLMEFGFDGKPVRVVMVNGEPMWVAKDVCEVLGYRDAATGTRMLRPSEKGTHPVRTLGGEQDMLVVNEPGLYRLVMRSDRPEAEAFQDWVTGEVLPSIRKNGMYVTPALLDDPEHLLEVTKRLVEERRARLAAEAKLIEQKPMVTFAETCLKSKDSILVRELAKVAHDQGVEIGQNRLYKRLREWGLILQDSTEPSQRAMDAGYFEVMERPVQTPYGERLTMTTKVTPKGQVYIIEKLRAEHGQGDGN